MNRFLSNFFEGMGIYAAFAIITFLLCLLINGLNLSSKKEKEEEKKNAVVLRAEIELENNEAHEVYIITTDSSMITDHCDDCRFCKTQNPEGNED